MKHPVCIDIIGLAYLSQGHKIQYQISNIQYGEPYVYSH